MTLPRILFIRGARGITDMTGAESYLFTLMQGLNALGCETMLVFLTKQPDEELPFLDIAKNKGLSYRTIRVERRGSMMDLCQLPGVIREFKADIVHPVDHRADVVGVAAARFTGRAAVATFTGWTNWNDSFRHGNLYSWLDRQALLHSDAVLVDSKFHGKTLRFDKASPPQAIIPNGVDPNKFDPSQVQGSYKQKVFGRDDILLFGMIGRIHPNKGQTEFLEAAVAIHKNHPSARFIVVGDPTVGYEGYLNDQLRYISEQGLENAAVVTNFAHEEIPEVMASFDVLVAPSFIEGCSYTILEGMAMARPIIGSTAGGTPEVICHEETGLLVPPGDAGAIVDAAVRLIEHPEERMQFGQAARASFENSYTIEAMASRVLDLYRHVLTSREAYPRRSRKNRLKVRLQDAGVRLG